ncbi:spore coat U domain-containing protein [Burkholderia sp. FERM BP-3421]|jgi:spore coat protein U-like protein|uniref:Csu type fimbrial protein n=1 Tax=Burkholderia sp. FERM BP-3421 TaxID=1494466 RepID=UPI002360E9F9|nr:spore coat U domain-containing protein [Burkholderia sp. FERM BP-3421]WDD94929.1 spore coat U domain-containing protein [Burkholderia sp. FERM BP-3421]
MNHSFRPFLSAAAAALLAATPAFQPAEAAVYSNGTATATFNVTLTIQANCTIAATPLAFGTTGVLAAALNQQTTLSVTCSNLTPYNVGLDAGNVTGSTVTARLLAGTATGNTGTTVGFQLYQDSGHTTVWGNTQGTNTVGGTGSGSAQTINVYGQVAAQSTPKPDTYQTTVTATVYF